MNPGQINNAKAVRGLRRRAATIACMMIITILVCGCQRSDLRGRRLLLAHAISAMSYNGIPLNEEFNFSWDILDSSNGLWRRSNWVATGGNLFMPENAVIVTPADTEDGYALQLSVLPDQGDPYPYRGGEVQTVGENGGDFGYGYYEVRMKTTSEPGCCVSFFWIQAPEYGPEEIDIEFLTNEGWTPTTGTVHYTIHPNWSSNHTYKTQALPFNPSSDFHRYGFLRTPYRISYTVDGQIVQTYTRPPCNNIPRQKGYIMMNAWTGDVNWGGGPPAANAMSVYDWVRFIPGATSVPAY
jgi:beta-glucanase (GH16 family)